MDKQEQHKEEYQELYYLYEGDDEILSYPQDDEETKYEHNPITRAREEVIEKIRKYNG